MMKRSWWLPALLAPALLAGAGRAETLQQVLRAPQRQRVYDFAGVLSPADEAKLRNRIHGMEQRHLAQGAVVLVHRVEGDSIEGFANKVLNRWGVGERGRNNGFVLLAAMDERKWRLETGTGLEKKIPDAEASELMQSTVVPAFRQKRYAAGLDTALAAIQKRAASEAAATGSTGTAAGGAPDTGSYPAPVSNPGPSGFPIWLVILAVPLVIFASLFGNRNRGWRGSGGWNPWWNNGMNSFRNWSGSSNSNSSAPSSSSTPSSGSSGSYGGGSGSGGGASGKW